MKHPQLGEFEETILLVVCLLHDEAYGAAVQEALETHAGRTVTLSAVHAALHRLEKKSYLTSWVGGATSTRGGRRKRFFEITHAGKEALVARRQMRNRLWGLLPDLGPEGGRL
jgi:PadR family transcriptional regulator PadR